MIRVLLFEDNTDFAESIRDLLKQQDGIELVATFTNSHMALRQIQFHNADVVLMDIDMPGENGLQGLRQIRNAGSEVCVLMLTVFDDNERVFQSICNGASGYLLKSAPPEKLVAAIKDAYTGGAPMTSSVAKQVLKLFAQPYQNLESMQTLTQREHDVLTCLVRGYSYKMAAAELSISIETLRFHIKNVYSKLHVNSKSEAIVKALQNKLVN